MSAWRIIVAVALMDAALFAAALVPLGGLLLGMVIGLIALSVAQDDGAVRRK